MQNNNELYFDVGNTNIKWWLCSDNGIVCSGFCSSDISRFAMLSEDIEQLSAASGFFSAIYLASVKSDPFTQALADFLSVRFDVSISVFGVVPSLAGVSIAYDDPRALGVDRWLGMHAVNVKAKKAGLKLAVYISAGSALTVDFISLRGQHLGGLIAPGLGMQRAMLNSTDKSVTEASESIYVGNLGASTQSCVDIGVAAMVEGFIDRVAQQVIGFGDGATIYVAGGDSQFVVNVLAKNTIVASGGVQFECCVDAVLEGMRHLSRFDECLEFK